MENCKASPWGVTPFMLFLAGVIMNNMNREITLHYNGIPADAYTEGPTRAGTSLLTGWLKL
ncbi:MAG TPA: hypothetical protein VE521_07355 [Nitrososphaera sp.]|nr:hypothetical protein [Nitrososphaera sp.]